MVTGYEVGGFRDLTRIADSIERISDNTNQIAFVLDGIYSELVAHNRRREEEGEKPDDPAEIVRKAKEAFGHV